MLPEKLTWGSSNFGQIIIESNKLIVLQKMIRFSAKPFLARLLKVKRAVLVTH